MNESSTASVGAVRQPPPACHCRAANVQAFRDQAAKLEALAGEAVIRAAERFGFTPLPS